MPKATQFSIGLDNKRGMLAKLCATLKRAKVNIEAISVADNLDCCWVRLIPSSAPSAKNALTQGHYNFSTQKVLTVMVANKPGELERMAAKLAKAGVNINYIYASTGDGTSTMLVMSVSHLDAAIEAVG